MRNFEFQNDQFFHVFNRGVEKRDVFCDEKDFERFLQGMREFNDEMTKDKRKSTSDVAPIVEIIAFNLLLNHFHFCLKQNKEGGISKFMQKLANGYTKYFNIKNNRVGALFQGKFKAKLIDSPRYLNYLSAYIHGNPQIHGFEDAKAWPRSSYLEYLNHDQWWTDTDHPIIGNFESADEYSQFVNRVIKGSKKNKSAKELEF